MSKDPTFKASQTDWAYVDALQDEDIDLSDIPEVTEEQMAQAMLRVGGEPVPGGKRLSIQVYRQRNSSVSNG